jgi:hypothetical protein
VESQPRLILHWWTFQLPSVLTQFGGGLGCAQRGLAGPLGISTVIAVMTAMGGALTATHWSLVVTRTALADLADAHGDHHFIVIAALLLIPEFLHGWSDDDPTCHRVGSASLADGWGCCSVGSVVISSLSCPEVAFRSEGSGWALVESVGSSTPRLLVAVASGCCVDVSDASGCWGEVSDACGPGVEDWSDDWSSVADVDVVECGS